MALAISFAPLMNVRGFSNQLTFLDELFDKLEKSVDDDKPAFNDIFAFGGFDDGTDTELDDFHQALVDKSLSEESDFDINGEEWFTPM